MSKNRYPSGISRRNLLTAGGVTAPILAVNATKASTLTHASKKFVKKTPSKKNNVLFICCDDFSPRIGCFGDRIAKTPNLDRLARMGVRFEKNYCQYPLCAPSRASLMTGLAPDTTKVWDLNSDFRATIPSPIETLPQLFKKNGYFTARAGKIYHYNNPSEIGTPGFDDTASWDISTFPAGYDRTHDEELVEYYVSQKKMVSDIMANGWKIDPPVAPPPGQPKWYRGGKGPSGIRLAQDGKTPILPLSRHGDLGIALAGHASAGSDEQMTDYMVAESAIAMMAEHRNEPWFIAAGFFRPHVPFIVPSKYFDLYNLDEIELPQLAPNELSQAAQTAYLSLNPNYGMSELQHREAIRGHLAAISFVDAQVGRLLDALEQQELLENTIIVFWSDHGFMVGEHGQWEKHMLFERSVHTPLFFAGAGIEAKGTACRRVTEHLDIYPTLASLCNLEGIPSYLQGRDLSSLLTFPEENWSHPALSQVRRQSQSRSFMGYSLRTERYRYTIWGESAEEGEELYDYYSDPFEKKNIAKNIDMKKIKEKLRNDLEIIREKRRNK